MIFCEVSSLESSYETIQQYMNIKGQKDKKNNLKVLLVAEIGTLQTSFIDLTLKMGLSSSTSLAY